MLLLLLLPTLRRVLPHARTAPVPASACPLAPRCHPLRRGEIASARQVLEAMRSRRPRAQPAGEGEVPTDLLRAAHRRRSGVNAYALGTTEASSPSVGSRYVAYQPMDGTSDLDV